MDAVCSVTSSPAKLANSNCPNCGFDSWRLPANLTAHELRRINFRIIQRRLLRRNEYQHKDPSKAASDNSGQRIAPVPAQIGNQLRWLEALPSGTGVTIPGLLHGFRLRVKVRIARRLNRHGCGQGRQRDSQYL